ncbi:PIN domain-containing protein [Sphingobium sp. BYY-5]|uniref:PIN domain-containing protein n=1 Tax=Sphingobium sp. BYY-5 TaxID=2926400 RepID=UPI001FA74A65|nr:PIN domain-containing protein [Sphingobium sp. BYY-5]MCI4588942.1 PIN domain-containing protein [Sphingobium sp. BYY-5]
MFLLDTPILLELRNARRRGADNGVTAWASRVARDRLFISALAIGELEAICARAARQDKASGAALQAWVRQQVVPAFDGHILPVDAIVALRRGDVAVEGERNALIAATALEHSLILVTFDKAMFKRARIRLLDPRTDDEDEVGEESNWRAASRSRPQWLRSLFIRG